MTDHLPHLTINPETGLPIPAPHYPSQPADSAQAHTMTATPIAPVPGTGRITRAEVLAIRRREREEGVDFPLAQTSKEAGREVVAKVRDLPFTDRMMLTGIPTELRASLNGALGLAATTDVTSVDDALGALESLDDLAKALCCAGFIRPRLVLHEHLLDGTDDCWLVDDLHPSEREAYRDFVMRDRDAAQQEVARLATFPGAAVAEAPTG